MTIIEHPYAAGHRADEPVPFVNPALPVELTAGFVVGHCGHRVARSEWTAGFRTCEHCPRVKATSKAVAR